MTLWRTPPGTSVLVSFAFSCRAGPQRQPGGWGEGRRLADGQTACNPHPERRRCTGSKGPARGVKRRERALGGPTSAAEGGDLPSRSPHGEGGHAGHATVPSSFENIRNSSYLKILGSQLCQRFFFTSWCESHRPLSLYTDESLCFKCTLLG